MRRVAAAARDLVDHAAGRAPEFARVRVHVRIHPVEPGERKLHAWTAEEPFRVVQAVEEVGGVQGILCVEREPRRVAEEAGGLRDAGHVEQEGDRITRVGGQREDLGLLDGTASRRVLGVEERAFRRGEDGGRHKRIERREGHAEGAHLAGRDADEGDLDGPEADRGHAHRHLAGWHGEAEPTGAVGIGLACAVGGLDARPGDRAAALRPDGAGDGRVAALGEHRPGGESEREARNYEGREPEQTSKTHADSCR